jgi:hypothetical protein
MKNKFSLQKTTLAKILLVIGKILNALAIFFFPL